VRAPGVVFETVANHGQRDPLLQPVEDPAFEPGDQADDAQTRRDHLAESCCLQDSAGRFQESASLRLRKSLGVSPVAALKAR
jgi:hypothetical protein